MAGARRPSNWCRNCATGVAPALLRTDPPDRPAWPSAASGTSPQTGVPIVPLRFTLSRAWQLPTWDSKRLPLPFSTITVRFEQPIFVEARNFDTAMNELADLL
jgi:hypothetical protein